MQATDPNQNPKKSRAAKGKGVADHGLPWQSILTPHTEAIWSWRKAGKTYREISALLAALGVAVAPSTVLRFIDARKRRFAKIALPDLPAPGHAARPPLAAPAQRSAPSATPSAVPSPSAPAGRRGMLPPQQTKHRDSSGKPVEPPPDPKKFRSENL